MLRTVCSLLIHTCRFNRVAIFVLALMTLGVFVEKGYAQNSDPGSAASGAKAPNASDPLQAGAPIPPGNQRGARINPEVAHDLSIPLRDMTPARHLPGQFVHELMPVPRPHRGAAEPDPVLQSSSTRQFFAPLTSLNFAGVGNGFSGPAGTFAVQSAPPDTNGSAGPNHYVQIVNSDFAIFDKSGTAIFGPVAINTLWSGFGGGCQTNNDGDPIVVYDKISDRWIISQFSVSSTPFLQCVAVSQTSDPTGAYFRYSFSYGTNNFPDYPKMGVWPDGYYVTFNFFNGAGSAFLGGEICAFDRASMLVGHAATQQCFSVGTNFGGLLPADLDGARLPPAGSPNYILSLGATANTLAFWKLHVDWTNTANTTLTGPTTLTTAAYAEACNAATCIPQSGTTQQLDSLADRLMYRLAYRNFGDHEALVTNHSITAGSTVGVRWYEIRLAGTNPTIFQQGTYAPDSNYRWMGSIATDQSGNMALGFSVSSSSLHPQIHYTGRLAGDAAGQMTQGEGSIIDGSGSQTGSSLSRWGDYSSMSIDPSDDCTFWYTNEYIPANGAFNWSTRVGTFKFPGCGSTSTNDFSMTASPNTVTVTAGGSGATTITTAITSGSAQTVNLTVSGLPAGASASFSPTSITGAGSSTLTLNSGTAAIGAYNLTVTGTGASATHATAVTFNINPVVTSDFSISASPSSLSVAPSANGTSTISTAITSGSAQSISLSASGLPAGASASFSPTAITSGGSSTVTINTGTAAAGSYTVTVTGTGSSATHSTSIALTITTSTGGGIINGGFETGNLSGWTATGAVATVVTGGHSGSFAARLGSTSPTNGDSTISQTFTAPTGATGIGLWYKMTCPDTVTYDWVVVTLKDNLAGTTATLVPKTCVTNASWVNVVGALTAGRSYTLTLTSHDDNYSTDPSYTLFDDVTTTSSAPPPSGITNGGFETGTFSGWTSSGVPGVVVSAGAHSGTFAARLGSTSPTNGDSTISQTFTAPTGTSTIGIWFKMTCPDTVTYDWATITLKNNTTGTTTTVLGKTCTTNAWTNRTASITPGNSYTLTLTSHDDNYSSDPSFTLYDDVTVQ
jgi:hypothetical protein